MNDSQCCSPMSIISKSSKSNELLQQLLESQEKIEQLLENSLHDISSAKNLQFKYMDGNRYSFAEQSNNSKNEIEEQPEANPVNIHQIEMYKKRIQVLESKLSIYESSLKSSEEENTELRQQILKLGEYEILYNQLVCNDRFKQQKSQNFNIKQQLDLQTDANAILVKEIMQLKIQYLVQPEQSYKQQLQQHDQQLQDICNWEQHLDEVLQLKHVINEMKQNQSTLRMELDRYKHINSYLHQQLEKRKQ